MWESARCKADVAPAAKDVEKARSVSTATPDCCYSMRDDQHRFLSLMGTPPARLTAEQAAWMLNCQVHDVPALVCARLLKPLGNPPANGIKFFATGDVIELAKDRGWLVKVTAAINQHWHRQNAKKKLVSSSIKSLSALASNS